MRVYGKSLWFLLRHRWISAIIWVVCMAGTVYFFEVVPKAFLPIGDSGFIFGLMIAQEGIFLQGDAARPERSGTEDSRDPAVDTSFTMTGNSGFFPANWGMVLRF